MVLPCTMSVLGFVPCLISVTDSVCKMSKACVYFCVVAESGEIIHKRGAD